LTITDSLSDFNRQSQILKSSIHLQGRRFNGRPAVSKTASGGSNPSAPARRKVMATMAKEVTEGVGGAVETLKAWPQQVKDYIEGLRMEMRRVTWPTTKQVQATTIVVIITVFLFGAFFALVDNVLNFGMSKLFNYFTR
jgi:preprotein translocase subunit SecE